MDCNKEEAIRAKDIAEKKMESKDFTGARKFALKAKQLCPELENIAQLLIVCDVHCASEQRLNGTELDWYKILQVELTDNDTTIKKQYRKFALQLHPDKNKFAGAEAAFKLIGEAQRVLLDKDKRCRLDYMYRRVSMNKSAVPSHNLQKVQMNFSSVVQSNVRPNFTNLNPQQQQQPRQSSQQGLNGGRSTFWTACSFCSVRYEYYMEVLNRSLRCQNCNRPFIAYDVGTQGTAPAANSTQQAFGEQKYGLNHGAFKVGVGSQGNLHAHKSNAESSEKKGPTFDVSGKPNGKRRKKRKWVAESSESSDSTSSTDSEDDIFADNKSFPGVEKLSSYREEHPRRSVRQRHQVSYKENVSDDDDDDILQPSKRGKGSGSSCSAGEGQGKEAKMNYHNGLAADLKDDQKEVKLKASEESLVNRNEEIKEMREKEAVGGAKTDEASDNVVYPDPEFSDFDKDKKEECFKDGQVWAIYDTADGMPRFYALIRKVFRPGFKLRITWFEPVPDDNDEIKWSNEQLPIACGKYKLGTSEICKDHLMFSHLILCEKIARSTYKVYPRKGETWAIFKNWDIKWYMDVESHQQYEYEFVEILSDYVEGEGVVVAYLAKLKGFVSLFSPIMKEGSPSFRIPSVELFRFSHRVPSFKMTGKEGVGVPLGSYELDPVSLPLNLEEVVVPEDSEPKVSRSPPVGTSTRSSDMLKFMKKSEGDASISKVNLERSNSAVDPKDSVDHINDGNTPSASAAEAFEIPDPKFVNFDAWRSTEKFQTGQIWAVYGDEDGLPKYYGWIQSVRTQPDFQLQVKYLTNSWLPEDAIRWEDKNMLISCGRFKVKEGGHPCVYNNNYSVSHLVHASTVGKSKECTIFPKIGETWALYRKWTTKIKRSDLENMEYDIVEIVGQTDLWIDVLFLELVGGYSSVFKSKSNGGSGMSRMTMRIPRKELLRFSHRIPSCQLTEAHGDLRGCWELDPGALPIHYLQMKEGKQDALDHP